MYRIFQICPLSRDNNNDLVDKKGSGDPTAGNITTQTTQTCSASSGADYGDKRVIMCEDKGVHNDDEHRENGTTTHEMQNGTTNGLQNGEVTINGELNGDENDSGLVSAASTPEATTPNEERSNTPGNQESNKQCTNQCQSIKGIDVPTGPEQHYTIKIVPPGTDSFELQVSSGELVQEMHQVLLDREDTCHRSCFSLQLDGHALDNFTELRNIPGMKDQVTLKVVEVCVMVMYVTRKGEKVLQIPSTEFEVLTVLHEKLCNKCPDFRRPQEEDEKGGHEEPANTSKHEPYTMREARIHVRHVRDLLRSMDPHDAYNGNECASLSFVNAITSTSPLGRDYSKRDDWKAADCTPPEYVMPGKKERLLTPLHSVQKETVQLLCLKIMQLSGWNPPPGNRKLRGDLLYLFVVTLEDKRYHITCCTKGFFVNQSTDEVFNPKPAANSHKFVDHSLIDLLSHLSPSFKRNFAAVQKRRCQRHIFERLPTPYQVFNWIVPSIDNVQDSIRAEDATQSHKLGYEDHIPGQTRDWNEELQTTRELPKKILAERLIRERAIFKIHSDFVAAAMKGAVAVVDGNVMAINPGDEAKMQMFIWNNIFFSLGFDVKDHYQPFGGDAAAFVAPCNDLQGVDAYFTLDQEGLYTLGTVVIDYRGYRVTAQSIIPGILEREQEQSVVYGSIDFGKTVVTSDKYKQLLESPAAQLKILPHTVVSEGGAEVLLHSSVETKGIVGNDSRYYVLDLLRTFPPDVNFLPDVDDVTQVCRTNGFPRQFPHKLACLRHELVDAFVESRYVTFIKIAAYHLQKLRILQLAEAGKETEKAASPTKDDMSLELTPNDSLSPDNAKVRHVLSSPGTPVVHVFPGDNKTPPLSEATPISPDKPSSSYDTKTAVTNGESEMNGEDEAKDKNSLQVVDGKLVSVDETTGKMTLQQQNGDQITAEIKRKIANCDDREESPSEGEGLPAEDEAKQIVNKAGVSKKSNDTNENETSEAATKEIIRKAAEAVASLSDCEFDIRFNPDCYCDTVKHVQTEDLTKQRRLVREAAHFLLLTQIPNFIRDCLDHSLTPVDGQGLAEALHSRGINMRYLGKIVQLVCDFPQLHYVQVIATVELVCRSAKHIFRNYLQSVEQSLMSTAVAHFLNCFLSTAAGLSSLNVGADDLQLRKRQRKRKVNSGSSPSDGAEWALLTSAKLWQQITDETSTYYAYNLDSDSLDSLMEGLGMQKQCVLRRVCNMCGIQMVLREYGLDNKIKSPFTDDDIVNLFPIVKHINPKASDATQLHETGQAKIQQGQLRIGYELVTEALNLLNNVYGAMHPEIAQCLRLLARLAYILGDHVEAFSHQHKAVLMSERCSGFDHPNTILEYMHLALYAFANLQINTSLKLLYRSRYLMTVVYGEDHPQMALIDSNIGLILHAVQEYDVSLKFLEHALHLHCTYHGRNSLKTALTYHLIARTQSCRGDFRTALQFEKETFTIYKNVFGEEHEKTKESGECLRHLTQQAVTFQKRMNEISRNPAAATQSIHQLLPLQIQQPSLQSVLEVLNVVNGIVFIQISPKEVEALRLELEKNGESANITEE